jgi:hypothetical protein
MTFFHRYEWFTQVGYSDWIRGNIHQTSMLDEERRNNPYMLRDKMVGERQQIFDPDFACRDTQPLSTFGHERSPITLDSSPDRHELLAPALFIPSSAVHCRDWKSYVMSNTVRTSAYACAPPGSISALIFQRRRSPAPLQHGANLLHEHSHPFHACAVREGIPGEPAAAVEGAYGGDALASQSPERTGMSGAVPPLHTVNSPGGCHGNRTSRASAQARIARIRLEFWGGARLGSLNLRWESLESTE